jgi:5-methylcytosine-specific restriction endonuclease McrA
MTTYKVISTITWKFESSHNHSESLDIAKEKLEEILDTHPHGDDFDNFSVQVDLAKMKDRNKLIHLGMFDPEEVFPYVVEEDVKKEYIINGKSYLVRMNSDRYHVFKKNRKCVSCGLSGDIMALDMNVGDTSPHFNLYAEEDGRLVLMTKDHILAKSKGGGNELDNYVTCCAICNNLKGAHSLDYSQVNQLRELHNNKNKLPKKELRDLIGKTRDEMAMKNHLENIEPHKIFVS